jgi:hypothetical protein
VAAVGSSIGPARARPSRIGNLIGSRYQRLGPERFGGRRVQPDGFPGGACLTGLRLYLETAVFCYLHKPRGSPRLSRLISRFNELSLIFSVHYSGLIPPLASIFIRSENCRAVSGQLCSLASHSSPSLSSLSTFPKTLSCRTFIASTTYQAEHPRRRPSQIELRDAPGTTTLMSVDIRQSLHCLRFPCRYESISKSQLSKAHTGDSTRPAEQPSCS